MLGLTSGFISCPSINISLNKCYTRSGIGCWPSANSNYIKCSLTYSSFTDNTATEYNCFWFNSGSVTYEIKSCNILRNRQFNLNSSGTIYTIAPLTIYDSCILENSANCIFYQSSSYTITLSNCTVDSTSNNGYLTPFY
jgi:hypothetical protein